MIKLMEIEVFGRRFLAKFVESQWELYRLSEEGKCLRVFDIIIPDFISANELPTYLGDILHEAATEQHPDVKVIRKEE